MRSLYGIIADRFVRGLAEANTRDCNPPQQVETRRSAIGVYLAQLLELWLLCYFRQGSYIFEHRIIEKNRASRNALVQLGRDKPRLRFGERGILGIGRLKGIDVVCVYCNTIIRTTGSA